jgi:hypothetical protein
LFFLFFHRLGYLLAEMILAEGERERGREGEGGRGGGKKGLRQRDSKVQSNSKYTRVESKYSAMHHTATLSHNYLASKSLSHDAQLPSTA